MRFVIGIALAIIAGPAAAQEVTIGRAEAENVFVWKDSEAQSEALKLIGAGVHKTNPQLVFRLMSCVAPAGSKAVVTDGGFASSTILITTGEHAGCRGVIQNEDLRG